MSQDAGVYPDLTVRQNLRYFAGVLGLPREHVERTLELTDLVPQADQLSSTLSGGQWRRVSLAVALLGSPRMLVLDEPTVGLDPVLRVDLWTLFRRLADEGMTLLASSHVMDEATRCDRLLLMRAGRILADAPPGELIERTGSRDAEEAFLKVIRANDERRATVAA